MEEKRLSKEELLSDYRKKITREIIALLKKGTIPWLKPWDWKNNNRFVLPVNGTSGRRYSGGNVVYLMAVAIENDYHDPRWFTFNQVKRIPGAYVKKGSKASKIIFWETQYLDEEASKKAGKEIYKKLKEPRYHIYNVFNAEQINGLNDFQHDSSLPWKISDRAKLITWLNNVPVYEEKIDEAYYVPSKDEIHVPLKIAFSTEDKYYGTLLHEVAHSTGHSTRLNRDLSGEFGSESYAKEELIAELAALFLCSDLKISNECDMQQYAAYIDSWISVLEKNEKALFEAAHNADEICRYLYGLEKKYYEEYNLPVYEHLKEY